jgi:hypothetical protein
MSLMFPCLDQLALRRRLVAIEMLPCFGGSRIRNDYFSFHELNAECGEKNTIIPSFIPYTK